MAYTVTGGMKSEGYANLPVMETAVRAAAKSRYPVARRRSRGPDERPGHGRAFQVWETLRWKSDGWEAADAN